MYGQKETDPQDSFSKKDKSQDYGIRRWLQVSDRSLKKCHKWITLFCHNIAKTDQIKTIVSHANLLSFIMKQAHTCIFMGFWISLACGSIEFCNYGIRIIFFGSKNASKSCNQCGNMLFNLTHSSIICKGDILSIVSNLQELHNSLKGLEEIVRSYVVEILFTDEL